MKHRIIINILAAAAAVLGTAACNKAKEKEFDPTDPAIYTVTVQPDGSVYKAEGEEFVFNFNAPDYWFVSSRSTGSNSSRSPASPATSPCGCGPSRTSRANVTP